MPAGWPGRHAGTQDACRRFKACYVRKPLPSPTITVPQSAHPVTPTPAPCFSLSGNRAALPAPAQHRHLSLWARRRLWPAEHAAAQGRALRSVCHRRQDRGDAVRQRGRHLATRGTLRQPLGRRPPLWLCSYASLAVNPLTGLPLVAFCDRDRGNRASVVALDGASQQWRPVGQLGFTPRGAYRMALRVCSAGTPFLAIKTSVASGEDRYEVSPCFRSSMK